MAELRPYQPPERPPQTLAERIKELEAAGYITPARNPGAKITPGGHVPGALQRFLDERD